MVEEVSAGQLGAPRVVEEVSAGELPPLGEGRWSQWCLGMGSVQRGGVVLAGLGRGPRRWELHSALRKSVPGSAGRSTWSAQCAGYGLCAALELEVGGARRGGGVGAFHMQGTRCEGG